METLRFLLTTTFYPPYHIGGDAVHVKYLADELVKLGHEVHVLHSLDAYYIKRKISPRKIEDSGVYKYAVRTPFSFSAYEAYIFGVSQTVFKRFENLVKQIKPHVVHHHNISLLGYGILRKQGNYVNLYTAHDYWLICQQNNLLRYGSEICMGGSCFFCALRCGRPPQLWRYRKEFRKVVENNIDFLIVPSNFIKNKILKKFRVKAVTLPNFAPELPGPIEPSGFSNFFLYAGVLEKHKGIMDLVNFYKEIANKIDTGLLIVGEGKLKDRIVKFVKKHELDQKIILLGWVDSAQLRRLLKDSKALIIPSILPENCPLIALEALSIGTPIVASNKGGLPEIVSKIDEKLIYNSTDMLKHIIENFDRKKYPPHKIREIYRKNYSPQLYLNEFFRLINSHLAEHKIQKAC